MHMTPLEQLCKSQDDLINLQRRVIDYLEGELKKAREEQLAMLDRIKQTLVKE